MGLDVANLDDRRLRAWQAAIAASPIVVMNFEPAVHAGYVLEGWLGTIPVRAWMTEGCNSVRLYDEDWVHFALVADTAWCAADRAIRLMVTALRCCGTRQPTDAVRISRARLLPGRG